MVCYDFNLAEKIFITLWKKIPVDSLNYELHDEVKNGTIIPNNNIIILFYLKYNWIILLQEQCHLFTIKLYTLYSNKLFNTCLLIKYFKGESIWAQSNAKINSWSVNIIRHKLICRELLMFSGTEHF